ncbi:hypothetical protein PspLS_09822 [Pyricularia sp. CBS 133598]|nr:hypothetical protein PspLS_09822 [Pyricularia sp. CBS 133598]
MQFFRALAILAMGISVSAIPLGAQQHGNAAGVAHPAGGSHGGLAKSGNCACPPRRCGAQGGHSKNRGGKLRARGSGDDDGGNGNTEDYDCPCCKKKSSICDDGVCGTKGTPW